MQEVKRKIRLNKKIMAELKAFFAKTGNIYTVYIFGSHGTDKETELSDIDFAIIYKGDIPLTREMEMAARIELILKQSNIDVINLNKAGVHLKHRVISTGEKIYEKDELITANFVESTLKIYFDFGITIHKLKKDFREGLRKEYGDGY